MHRALTIFTNPSARIGYDTRSIFKRSLTSLNSGFSFSLTSCRTEAEESSLPYYLPITGGRIIGFTPFPNVLVLCEMQSFSSRIWTRVTVSISYDDNNYTTGTSLHHRHLHCALTSFKHHFFVSEDGIICYKNVGYDFMEKFPWSTLAEEAKYWDCSMNSNWLKNNWLDDTYAPIW